MTAASVRLVASALLLGSCSCEQQVWSCPSIRGEGPGWPTAISAIYAPAGSAEAGARIDASLGDEAVGSGRARSDGSFLLGIRTYRRDTLANAVVALTIRGRHRTEQRSARIGRPAPVTFYRYGESCSMDAWTLDVQLAGSLGVPVSPPSEALGIGMSEPPETPLPGPPLNQRFAPTIEVSSCADPWFFFARHEDGTVSGCWDTCPPGATRCGGCTRVAWAAGRCRGLNEADAGSDAGPDAGSDAGVSDAAVDAPLGPPF